MIPTGFDDKEGHSTCYFHNLRIARSDLQVQLQIGEAHPVCVEQLTAQGKKVDRELRQLHLGLNTQLFYDPDEVYTFSMDHE